MKSSAAATRFLDATVQRTIPGIRGAEIITEWKLLLIWNESRAPRDFVWQPAAGAPMACSVQKIHHYTRAVGQERPGYELQPVALPNIRRGDTLEILPVPSQASVKKEMGGKGLQPEVLYYQTVGSNSRVALKPVLRRLEDLIMP